MSNIIAERDAQAQREQEARDNDSFFSEVFGPWLAGAIFTFVLVGAMMLGMLALEPGPFQL